MYISCSSIVQFVYYFFTSWLNFCLGYSAERFSTKACMIYISLVPFLSVFDIMTVKLLFCVMSYVHPEIKQCVVYISCGILGLHFSIHCGVFFRFCVTEFWTCMYPFYVLLYNCQFAYKYIMGKVSHGFHYLASYPTHLSITMKRTRNSRFSSIHTPVYPRFLWDAHILVLLWFNGQKEYIYFYGYCMSCIPYR